MSDKYPATFIISYSFDEFLNEEAERLGKTKSSLVEEILIDYISKIKNNEVKPEKYPLLKNNRYFLSVKIERSLNRELKHLAIYHDVSRQDILNCAIDAYISKKEKMEKEVAV